jgi:hypothetical protein
MRLPASEIFDITSLFLSGFVEVTCFCKHFVNGACLANNEIVLRASTLTVTGTIPMGELKPEGGTVQLFWRTRIQMLLGGPHRGILQGGGNLIYSYAYSVDESSGRIQFETARRHSAIPRANGFVNVTYAEDNPPARSAGTNHTVGSAFDMNFAASLGGGSAGVSVGPLSASTDQQPDNLNSCVRCEADANFNSPPASSAGKAQAPAPARR